jgi:hypothetical protein
MRARISISLLLALGSIASAAPALAGDGASPALSSGRGAVLPVEAEAQEPIYVEHSYLDDVIALDTTNLALTIVTAGFGSVITVPSYLLGAPAIHASHGNRGQAALSLGVRAGLPVLGALAGKALYERNQRRQEPCSEDESTQCGTFVDGLDRFVVIAAGAIIGATGAVVFDWIVLDHSEKVPARSLVVVPQVGVSEQGVSLGVSGRF